VRAGVRQPLQLFDQRARPVDERPAPSDSAAPHRGV